MPPRSSHHALRISAVAAGLLCAAVPFASAQTAKSQAKAQEERSGFFYDERPSFRWGEAVRLDLRSLVDFEWRGADGDAGDGAAFGRRRIGVDGRLFGVLAFEIERDLGDGEDPWRDVLVEFRPYRALRVRAGHFKVPFGAERLTPVSELEFVRRSTVTETLTQSRQTGVQLSGRVLGGALAYAAGTFRHDDQVDGTDSQPRASRRTLAARLTVTPFARAPSRMLRRIEAGFGATDSDLGEGLNSVSLKTSSGYEAFAPMYVSGARRRVGADVSLAQGRFSARGEVLRLADQRRGQSLVGDDLPRLVARGWQANAAWVAIGDLKDGGAAPRRSVFGGGPGAIQLAVRLEGLTFRSDANWDEPFRNPRAANVLPNDFRAWTAGVNWHPIRHVTLQFNLIRERLGDPERRPDASRAWTTSRAFRVQFSL